MNYGILGIFIAKDIFHLLLQDGESHVSTLFLHKVKSCHWKDSSAESVIIPVIMLLYQLFTDKD